MKEELMKLSREELEETLINNLNTIQLKHIEFKVKHESSIVLSETFNNISEYLTLSKAY